MMAADSNPWHSRGSALGINLGDPARVLTVGRKHGLLSADSDKEMERCAASQLSARGSVKMIRNFQEIADLTEELHQVDISVHKFTLDKATADVTHVDRLEKQLARVNGLLSHLSEAVTRKDRILAQLQARVVDNSIKIEAPYQVHAHSVLTSLGESVTTLPANLSSLEWANRLQLDETQLTEKLSQGEKLLSQCQSMYYTVQRLHQAQQNQTCASS